MRERVVTVVNNSIFQASSPFRHASRLAKIMRNNDAKILMKMTDGGVDNRKTLESVKCSLVCLLLERIEPVQSTVRNRFAKLS